MDSRQTVMNTKQILTQTQNPFLKLIILALASFLFQASTVWAAWDVATVSVGAQTGTLTYGTRATATFPVTVTGSGNGGQTHLYSVLGLPAGATAVFIPASASSGQLTSTLWVTNAVTTLAGVYTITVSNETHTATATLTINKANATVVVTPYTVTYDGNSHTATVTSITGVNGQTGATVGSVTLNTTHTAAGTYASDSWSFTGTANYNNIAATTITDTINKANATVVVTPYNVTYDGTAHTATVTSITGVNGETGATVGSVALNTTHTAVGTYASDSWSFTGAANYNNIAATTITDTINKANATVVVTPYNVTYDGTAHTATVTSITGVNGETGGTVGSVTLNTTHTAVGTYASDSWSFTGAANYNNIAATTITDTINKANATVVVTPYNVTYDGTAHTATVTSITGVNGETGGTVGSVTLNTTHTVAGTYASDSWSFAGTANYNDIGATTISDTIAKANATVVVTPYSVTYDGAAHTAAVTSITGVNTETGATVGTVDVSSTTHTDAGTYASDSWSFTGAANYNNIAATTISDTINQATVTITSGITADDKVYDGTTSGTISSNNVVLEGVLEADAADVALSTNGYTATFDNAGPGPSIGVTVEGLILTGAKSGDYALTQPTDLTAKIGIEVTITSGITPDDKVYDGTQTATISSNTVVLAGVLPADAADVALSTNGYTAIFDSANAGMGIGVTVGGLSLTGDKAGSYVLVQPTGLTANIGQVTPTIVVTPYSVTYDGAAHTATVTSITGVNGETGGTVGTVDVSSTTHTDAGTYASDSWSFTGTANYNDIAATAISDTIAKADATVVVAPYSVTYDGAAHTATVTSITGVNSEMGPTVGTVDVSSTTHTDAGTYATDSWSFTGAANYNDIGATTISDTIGKADATVVVTPYGVAYDGAAHTATVTSITGVNSEMGPTVGTVDVSSTTHTDAGTYATDSWSFTGGANYNDIAATTISDTIAKASAAVVVTPYSVTYDGAAHTATVTSITGVNGENGPTVGSVTLNTTHTDAGTYATDSWSFTGAANYNNIAATTITDTISKANATVVATPYSVTYDGAAHTATVTSITGVNSETGPTVGTVDVSSTTHTDAGTYATDSWSFTGTANYNDIGATTISDTIAKANATVVVDAVQRDL